MAFAFISNVSGLRHLTCDRQHLLGRGAPAYCGDNVRTIELHNLVKMRIVIAVKFPPAIQRDLPLASLWRMGSSLHVIKGLLVRGDQARTGTCFNRHVANRHAAFHGKCLNDWPSIFNHMPRGASGANFADDGKNHILGRHTRCEASRHMDLHVAGFLLLKCLGGQHMLHFGGSYAMGKRTKSTMGGCVGVTAYDGHAGKG